MIVNLKDNSVLGWENLRTKLPLDIWYRIHRGIQRLCPLFCNAALSPDDLPLNLLNSFTSHMTPNLRSRFSLVGRLPTPRISYEDLMAQNSGSEEEEDPCDSYPVSRKLVKNSSTMSLSSFLATSPSIVEEEE